jgi:two-component system sensor kinase
MLGGAVDIQTSQGNGFALSVTIPAEAVQMQELQS